MECDVVVRINPTDKLITGKVYSAKYGDGTILYLGVAFPDDIVNLVSLKSGTIYYKCSANNFVDVTDQVKVTKI